MSWFGGFFEKPAASSAEDPAVKDDVAAAVADSEASPTTDPIEAIQADVLESYPSDKLADGDETPDFVHEKPSRELAEAAREAAHPRDAEGKRFPLFASERTLGEVFGPGICLYFKNLWWMALIFTIVMILHIPQLIITYNADKYTPGYDNTESTTDSGSWSFADAWKQGFTLGGLCQSDLPGQLVFLGNYIVMWGDQLYDKNDALYIIAALDLVSMLIIVGCCAFLYGRVRKISEQIDGHTVSIDDYSLEILGLPEDAKEDEVTDYVVKVTGDTPHDVVLLNKVAEVLGNLKKRGRHVTKARSIQAQMAIDENLTDKGRRKLEKKLAKTHSSIERVDTDMAKGFKKGLDAAEVVAAFVTFPTEEDRAENLVTINTDPTMFRDEYKITARRARPPEDYKYESLSYTKAEKIKRKVKTWLIVVGIMAIAATAYVALRMAQQAMINDIHWDKQAMEDYVKSAVENNGGQLDALVPGMEWYGSVESACTATLDVCAAKYSSPAVVVTLDYGEIVEMSDRTTGKAPSAAYTNVVIEALQACSIPTNLQDVKELASSESANCELNANNPCLVCYCQGLSTKEWSGNAAKTVRTQCAEFITDTTNIQVVKVTTSIVTAVTNVIIQLIMRQLVEYAKYDTTSTAERAIFLKIALLQLINTIIVPVLAQAYFEGFSYTADSIFSSGYPDYIQSWYSGVGAPMVLTLLIQIGIQLLIKSLGYIMAYFKRRSKKLYTQEEMNAAFVGKSFTLADKYAKTAFFTGVAICYGQGMPMLYLAAMISYAFDSVVERHRLLRFNAKPPRFDMDLEIGFLRMVMFFVVIHLAIAMWMFSYFRTGYIIDPDTSADMPPNAVSLSTFINTTVENVATLLQPTSANPYLNLTSEQKQQIETWVENINTTSLQTTVDEYGDSPVWATSSTYYINSDGRYNPSRIFQKAAVFFTFPFFLCVVHIILDWIFKEKYQAAIRKYICCCIGHWTEVEEHGHPPLLKAIADKQLMGPASYRLADDPRYKQLFAHVEDGKVVDDGEAIKKLLQDAVTKYGDGTAAAGAATGAAAAGTGLMAALSSITVPDVQNMLIDAGEAVPGAIATSIV